MARSATCYRVLGFQIANWLKKMTNSASATHIGPVSSKMFPLLPGSRPQDLVDAFVLFSISDWPLPELLEWRVVFLKLHMVRVSVAARPSPKYPESYQKGEFRCSKGIYTLSASPTTKTERCVHPYSWAMDSPWWQGRRMRFVLGAARAWVLVSSQMWRKRCAS